MHYRPTESARQTNPPHFSLYRRIKPPQNLATKMRPIFAATRHVSPMKRIATIGPAWAKFKNF